VFEERYRWAPERLRSAGAKAIAKEKIREAARESAAFGARSNQLVLAYAGFVIGNLPLDRGVVRRATAIAILHAASHPARVGRLSCKGSWRRDGRDQQENRRKERPQSC